MERYRIEGLLSCVNELREVIEQVGSPALQDRIMSKLSNLEGMMRVRIVCIYIHLLSLMLVLVRSLLFFSWVPRLVRLFIIT